MKPVRAARFYIAVALLGTSCEAPFQTSGSGEARPDSVPSDTALDIPPPAGTSDTDSTRPTTDSVARPSDSASGPGGLDSGVVRGGGIRAVPVFDPAQVPLERPVWFGALPGRSEAYIALEQFTGTVVLISRTAQGWGRSDFLKLAVRQEGELGLLGIAFHPRFAENRKYYVQYVPRDGSLTTVIEEREADAGLLKDAGKPARTILRLAQPYQNHKSALPVFGPKDGYLYVPVGDGGATVAGQDSSRLLGKILRLDVAAPDSFRIPADNPFRDRAGIRPEIWALGVRNPWRWSFDALTGEMWIGDVGEDQREEIDIAEAGDNLGWGAMEGGFCHAAECAGVWKAPVMDFTRDKLTVVIGGYVYRGDAASPWYGAYFFADYASHAVWVMRRGADGKAAGTAGAETASGEARKLLSLPTAPSSFGADAAGNLYVVGHGNGVIYRLEADPGATVGSGRL
jgi:glucose/arabinose dehydrogenase